MEHGHLGQVTTLVQKYVEEELNPKQEVVQTQLRSMEGQIVLVIVHNRKCATQILVQVKSY